MSVNRKVTVPEGSSGIGSLRSKCDSPPYCHRGALLPGIGEAGAANPLETRSYRLDGLYHENHLVSTALLNRHSKLDNSLGTLVKKLDLGYTLSSKGGEIRA